MKLLFTGLLLLVNLMLFLSPTSLTIFPYIPPLTHTPGMGISLLGEPQMPPFIWLDSLQHFSRQPCAQCPELERTLQHHLEQGKQSRLDMQQQTLELLTFLPEETIHNALLDRDENEHRIGEVLVWEKLQQ